MEDLVFADFCAEIDVGSIREYEQEQLKEQAEHDKKRYKRKYTQETFAWNGRRRKFPSWDFIREQIEYSLI